MLLLFWLLRAEFDNMRDGIIYGALVGLGFNWFEAALYVAQGYAEYGVAPYGAQFGSRYALFGLGGHALFTGIFGASLGLAIQTRRRWIRILAPIAGLVLAIAAHMLNNALPLLVTLAGAAAGMPPPEHEPPPDTGFLENFVGDTLTQLVIFLPFFLIMALAVWRSGVWERRVIREELPPRRLSRRHAGRERVVVRGGTVAQPRERVVRERIVREEIAVAPAQTVVTPIAIAPNEPVGVSAGFSTRCIVDVNGWERCY